VNGVRNTARVIFPILLAAWAGVIIGLSFIATPVKFQAPSLSMPVALEVGRYTFRLFANVELGFLISAVAAACLARPRRLTLFVLSAVGVQLLLQRYWLLPELDRRVSQILAGGTVGFSASHWVYVAFDVFKTAILIAAAAMECGSQYRS
jgi:hypothetical protein